MKARHLKFFAVLLAALTLIGCDQGRKAPAKTRVRIVNAAPSFAQLWYQREHPTLESPDALAFKGVTGHDYDVDTYDFYVYHKRVATGEILNTWTWSKELVADQQYTFVLTEAAGQVSPQIVEYSSNAREQRRHADRSRPRRGKPARDGHVRGANRRWHRRRNTARHR